MHWQTSDALLLGKIFDDSKGRMTASDAMKRGNGYRHGVAKARAQVNKVAAGSVRRVAAQDIEDISDLKSQQKFFEGQNGR